MNESYLCFHRIDYHYKSTVIKVLWQDWRCFLHIDSTASSSWDWMHTVAMGTALRRNGLERSLLTGSWVCYSLDNWQQGGRARRPASNTRLFISWRGWAWHRRARTTTISLRQKSISECRTWLLFNLRTVLTWKFSFVLTIRAKALSC
jgi:hypothetical protein